MYTQQQTVFVLSMLSNLAITQKGTVDELEAYLAGRIDAHLAASQSNIGVWTRVWGPAVFQAPLSSVADNVMYVASNTSAPPQYVIGIAGTNFNSAFDILIEDFWVGTEVDWSTGTPPPGSDPKIAAGTFTGFSILRSLRPGPAMPGANQFLDDFLKSAASHAIDIVAAGHSLGGALAPALALWLHDTRADWDPQSNATISCEPSAGPTSGNADFAEYDDQTLGSSTTRLYNSLDIVPHAWNYNDLSALPPLYQPAISPDLVVDGLVAAAQAASKDGDYTQIDNGTPALTGTINTSIIDPRKWAFENYMAQAGYQHIDEYLTLLGVTISAEAMTAVRIGMGAPAAAVAASRIRAQLVRRGVIAATTQ